MDDSLEIRSAVDAVRSLLAPHLSRQELARAMADPTMPAPSTTTCRTGGVGFYHGERRSQ